MSLPSTMQGVQAIVKDGVHSLIYEPSLAVPSLKNKPHHILIRVHASFINPSDSMNVNGGFPHTTFPRIPGRDYSGIVVAPESSPLFQKAVYGTSGHEISFTTDGAQAEYLAVPEYAVALKPSNLSHVQAATVGTPFTTAMLSLKRAQAKKGETVMVLGATGSVGTAVTQLAERMGCKVLTVSRRDTTSINSSKDPELKSARELTGGKGPDIAVDTVGELTLMHTALTSLAQGGRLVVITVGAAKDGKSEMSIDMKSLYRVDHSMLGCNSLNCTAQEMAGYMNDMRDGFEQGHLEPMDEKSLTRVKIQDAVGAYEGLKDGSKKGAKFVVVFADE